MQKTVKSFLLAGLVLSSISAFAPSVSSAQLLDDRVSADNAKKHFEVNVPVENEDYDSDMLAEDLSKIFNKKEQIIYEGEVFEFPARETFFSLENFSENGNLIADLEPFKLPNVDHDGHIVPSAMNCPWVAEFIGAEDGDYSNISFWCDESHPADIQFKNHATGEVGFMTKGFQLHKHDKDWHGGSSKGMSHSFKHPLTDDVKVIMCDGKDKKACLEKVDNVRGDIPFTESSTRSSMKGN